MAGKIIKTVFQFRRATATEWEANKTVVPAAGEPCFVIDKNILKIGDGVATFEELEPINGVNVEIAADGKSVVLKDNVFSLIGFDAAEVGAQPRKAADGTLEWIVPSTETVDGLQSAIAGLKSDVKTLQDIVGTTDEGEDPLITRVQSLETKMDGTGEGTVDAKIDAKINAWADNVTDNGTVDTIVELVDYVAKHGVEASKMASDITTLQSLVGDTSVAEQIAGAVAGAGHIVEDKAMAIFSKVKYEVAYKPVGTLVDYRDKEIRVMCPANTEWALQNSGENADANMYYIGFKAYAPSADVVGFKEDLAEVIGDNTLYSFEDNEFAGVDKFGRKYSVVWLPAARYDAEADTWTYYGSMSSTEKYIGWYYSVEWYNAEGKIVATDTIRINLSDEKCHTNIKPYYAEEYADKIEAVKVGDTLLDIVEKTVVIPVGAGLKTSEEIKIAEDGTLFIGAISFDKIAQGEAEIVMDGGGAAK